MANVTSKDPRKRAIVKAFQSVSGCGKITMVMESKDGFTASCLRKRPGGRGTGFEDTGKFKLTHQEAGVEAMVGLPRAKKEPEDKGDVIGLRMSCGCRHCAGIIEVEPGCPIHTSPSKPACDICGSTDRLHIMGPGCRQCEACLKKIPQRMRESEGVADEQVA